LARFAAMKRESTALRCRGDRIETWLIIAAAKAASDRRRNGVPTTDAGAIFQY
jgi:hypothetical protein